MPARWGNLLGATFVWCMVPLFVGGAALALRDGDVLLTAFFGVLTLIPVATGISLWQAGRDAQAEHRAAVATDRANATWDADDLAFAPRPV